MLRRILGVIAFVFGVAIVAWLGYQRFVERAACSFTSDLKAMGFAVAFIGAGWQWMRGEEAR